MPFAPRRGAGGRDQWPGYGNGLFLPITWSGVPGPWPNCTDAAGISKCSSRRSSRQLQLADFLGNLRANAIQWQTWMGLLVRFLRYLAFLHGWAHSFTRLFTVVRAVLWRRWCLHALVDSYGTAKPPGRLCAALQQAYLPGLHDPVGQPLDRFV